MKIESTLYPSLQTLPVNQNSVSKLNKRDGDIVFIMEEVLNR